MRHSAWLNTVPEKATQPRYKNRNDSMPPLNEGGYLIGILFEVGPVHPAGMGGTVAITDQDLRAWQANQGVDLSPWECSTLRGLSREYSSQLAVSTEPNCAPPWIEPSELMSIERAKAQAKAWADWEARVNAQRGIATQ